MFYVTHSRLLTLLCYVRSQNVTGVPVSMRILRRVVRRWSNAVRMGGILSQHRLSMDVVVLNRWRLNNDLMYAFSVRVLLDLLQECLQSFFRIPLWIDPEAAHVQLATLELTDSEAGALCGLRSQIIALIGRPNRTDPSIWQNTCSLQDVTLVSNLVDWLSGLFPLENCMVEAFLRFPSLRNDLVFKWSRACLDPSSGFNSNALGRFLLGPLERRNEYRRVFVSLSFMLVWFIAFFMRFSAEFSLSEETQAEILRVIFRDVCTRLSVFDAADLAPFWFQNAFRIIGSLCAACLPIEWRDDLLPLIFQEVLLESGTGVYDCVPLDEARLISVFSHRFSHPIQYWHANSMFYDAEGRLPPFSRLSLSAVIGRLGESVIWRTWREVYLPVCSSLFPQDNSLTPGLLSSYASRAILLDVHRGRAWGHSSLFADVLNRAIFCPIHETSSLRSRCVNLRRHMAILRAVSLRMNLGSAFLASVQEFLAAPEINRYSSEERLDQCSGSLALMMRSMPFCGYSFYQSVCLSYMVEHLLDHLFGIASCLPENRLRVISLGSRRMASCFWYLVSYALLDLQQEPIVSIANRIRFFRTFFVLYDRYFVRRRPLSEEERNARR